MAQYNDFSFPTHCFAACFPTHDTDGLSKSWSYHFLDMVWKILVLWLQIATSYLFFPNFHTLHGNRCEHNRFCQWASANKKMYNEINYASTSKLPNRFERSTKKVFIITKSCMWTKAWKVSIKTKAYRRQFFIQTLLHILLNPVVE